MTDTQLAKEAYEHLASSYDRANAQNDYETWVGRLLLPRLKRWGLRTGWALDVGCGTGRAFDPLLQRGWRVVGCDLSPAMLAVARSKFGQEVQLLEADACDLPPFFRKLGGQSQLFDLVLLLNDVVNYITVEEDLSGAFAGVRENLNEPGGLVVFDVNTLSLYRTAFADGVSNPMESRGLIWEGLSKHLAPSSRFQGRMSGPGIRQHIHEQRHWTVEELREALAANRLNCLEVLGQREDGGEMKLSEAPDEDRDYKLIVIAEAS